MFHAPEPLPASGEPAALAAAESAFAAQSVREGMRAAFLSWLAPGATLYRDGPVNGRPSLPPIPIRPSSSTGARPSWKWRPRANWGSRPGPGRSRGARTPPPRPATVFVSIWKRDGGGPWRVQVDLGISHPGPALATAPLHALTTPAGNPGSSGTLAQAEARFAQIAAHAGDAGAYANSVSASVRLYREGHAPFLGGRRSVLSAARQARTAWTLETQEVTLQATSAMPRAFSLPRRAGPRQPIGFARGAGSPAAGESRSSHAMWYCSNWWDESGDRAWRRPADQRPAANASASRANSSRVCASPTRRPWTWSRWCWGARSTRILSA